MTSTPVGRHWMILALAIAVLGAAAVAVFVTGQQKPRGIWMVDQKTGCRIWDDLPAANELVSWSGDCKDGYAEGHGTAQWIIKGINASCSRPVVSGSPHMRFMFCTAWPAAPLVRLSITDSTTTVPRSEEHTSELQSH